MHRPDIDDFLQTHAHWRLVNQKLQREYTFSNFAEGFAFMSAVARHADAIDHHPEWSQTYTSVVVALYTHTSGDITTQDLQLAEAMDRIAEKQ